MKRVVTWLLAAGMSASVFGLTYATQPSQVEQAQAATMRYAQVDYLNIRSGPTTKYRIVGKVMSGKEVYIIDFVDNSTWYKIYHKGVIGYATSQYVYFYH